jgi:hypothetical protein
MIRHYDMSTGEVMTNDLEPITQQVPRSRMQAPQPRLLEITDAENTAAAERQQRRDAVIVESLLRHLAD